MTCSDGEIEKKLNRKCISNN